MDPSEREIVLRRLEAMARARDYTARQREIVAKLQSVGHDPTQARQLFATFAATQANHERRLAMLLDELIRRGWKHEYP